MCDVTLALAGISTAMTAAGTLGSMQAANQQAAAQRNAYEYQRVIAENNRVAAENNAKTAAINAEEARLAAADARERGRLESSDYLKQVRQLSARARAVLAGNGVLVDDGTSIDISSDIASQGKRDELQIRSNAEREAMGYMSEARNLETEEQNFRTQGINFQNEAGMARAAGQNALAAGRTRARSALFEGVGSVASTWYGVADTKGWLS